MAEGNGGAPPLFDCSRCLGFCCSVYEEVNIRVEDLVRIAEHFGIGVQAAAELYTNPGLELKRKPDDLLLYDTCVFFDTEKRCCGIYEARPGLCRDWPKVEHAHGGAEGRCPYYDLYVYAQKEQGTPNMVPLIKLGRLVNEEAHAGQE